MLSIGAMSGGQAGYYLSLAKEDYYLSGGEPPGVWVGAGAEALGLIGTVSSDALYNLFDGLSPDGSRSLVQLQRHEGKQVHRPGWDLTFSAPKSVSVLWSQSDETTQRLIQHAHFEAVKSALSYVEETAALSRRGKNTQFMDPAKLVVATFEHSTSRALDAQLHTHALLLNVCVRPDGTTGTVSSLSIFQAKMAAGALYRADFANRLEQDLGLETRRDKSSFEVAGVSKFLCEAMSKRRADIEAEVERQGITSARGTAKATIETRSTKIDVSRETLFVEWGREGERHHWSRKEASRLIGSFTRRRPDTEDAVSAALSRLMAQGAHFSELEFTRTLAEEAQGRGLDAANIRRVVPEVLEGSPDIVKIGLRSNQPHFTLAATLKAEEAFFRDCSALSQRRDHAVRETTLARALERADSLSDEQKAAVRHLTVGSGDLAILSGIAGSGKTQTLQTAARIWETEGYTVQGLALSGRAARELGDRADINCTTIAKSLYELDKSPFPIRWHSEARHLYFDFSGRQYEIKPKTVLVLDEASMINTADFGRLAQECQNRGAKLVAAGDPRQLQAILGASPFGEMINRFGSAVLDTILRQKEKWAREAVREFSEGEADIALQKYAERGLVTVTSNHSEARAKLIDAWKGSKEKVADRLILTDRREDADALNKLAQEARKGELGLTWTTVDDKRLYLGDRVSFTKTSQARGVHNGDRGVLIAINPLPGHRAATIKRDDGEKVTIDLARFPHLDLGYASTTHRAQGETVQEAFVLTGSPMQDKHLAYVQASRARERTHFFMTEIEAGHSLTEMARRMSKEHQRATVHEELTRQRGISI